MKSALEYLRPGANRPVQLVLGCRRPRRLVGRRWGFCAGLVGSPGRLLNLALRGEVVASCPDSLDARPDDPDIEPDGAVGDRTVQAFG